VVVETRLGKVLERIQPTRKGDPDQPLTDKEVEEKFFELSEPVIGETAAKSLLETLWSLDELDSADIRLRGAAAARS
jgi:2-methylcitrate dehydratase PrpD